MKKLSLFTMVAMGAWSMVMEAADTGGASGAAGEAGKGEEKPKKNRLVIAFETSGEADAETLAEDIKDLLEGEDGVKLLAVSLQEEGKPSADLLGAPPADGGKEAPDAELPDDETAEDLVSGNSKEELLKIAEDEEVEDVDDRHTKPEIAAAIVAKRTSGRNPGDGQK